MGDCGLRIGLSRGRVATVGNVVSVGMSVGRFSRLTCLMVGGVGSAGGVSRGCVGSGLSPRCVFRCVVGGSSSSAFCFRFVTMSGGGRSSRVSGLVIGGNVIGCSERLGFSGLGYMSHVANTRVGNAGKLPVMRFRMGGHAGRLCGMNNASLNVI